MAYNTGKSGNVKCTKLVDWGRGIRRECGRDGRMETEKRTPSVTLGRGYVGMW